MEVERAKQNIAMYSNYHYYNNKDHDNNDNINGNDNKIQTNEIRKTEVSMVHIEGLQGQLSTSKWVMFLGFSFIFISMIYAALHS